MWDENNKDERSSDSPLGKLCACIPDVVFSVASGCVAFGTTLAVSTAAQKAIGISTATNVVPSLLGFATVCAASLVSEQAAVLTHQLQKDPKKRNPGYIARKFTNQISESSSAMVESSSHLRRGKNHKIKFPVHEVQV
jgi:hypothetical protein